MQNNFIRITTILSGIRYINISHITSIQEYSGNETQITTTSNVIHTNEPAVILLERIHKIQWNGETKITSNDTKEI